MYETLTIYEILTMYELGATKYDRQINRDDHENKAMRRDEEVVDAVLRGSGTISTTARKSSCMGCVLIWLALSGESHCFIPRPTRATPSFTVRSRVTFLGAQEDPNELIEKAKKLRKDVESFEASKRAAENERLMEAAALQAERQELKERYSAVVPILKPDGSTQQERCDFTPRWPQGESRILVFEARLPIGMILGESENFRATTVVDVVAEGSNGEAAGLKVGDLIRAFTACKVEMEMPTWQILAGGIGIPKTKRFMYSADGRPFEEVMEAVASNRQDPEERPVLFVVERQEKL